MTQGGSRILIGAVQLQARREPGGGRNVRLFTEISYLAD
jgi:hypothetical protein